MKQEKQNIIKPPKVAEYILERILSEYNDFALLGDFNEEFSNIFRNKGSFSARLWYWKQVVISFPKLLVHLIYWGVVMINNYLKIALRNFSRHRTYSFINIFGLALGIAACVLILMWVVDETSYDKFHKNGKNIYRVTYAETIGDEYSHYALTPFPSGPAFYEEIPEVKNYVRIYETRGLITWEDNKFDVDGIIYADTTFFDIFSFDLLKGNPSQVLRQPKSIVLTEESALKIFGNEDPIGKSIELSDRGTLTVTGIVKNCPKNSHFDFNFIVSMNSLEGQRKERLTYWLMISGWVYLLLDDNADPQIVENKMAQVVDSHIGERARELNYELFYHLQNVQEIHLNSHLIAEFGPNGDEDYVNIFSIVAIFILLLACINFTNLSTAKSVIRSKEVGLRKVLGAHRGKLIYQFITESALMTSISFILSIIIIAASLPMFNEITGKEFSLFFLLKPFHLLGLISLLMFTGIAAGSYPAFYISSYQPADVLKNTILKGFKNSSFRNSLVIFQFVVSILLAASTLIILQQMNLMKETDLGFNKDQVLLLKIKGNNFNTKGAAFRNELLQHNNIKSAAFTSGVPGDVGYVLTIFQKGKPKSESINSDVILCDFGLVDVLNLELIAGRDFSPLFVSDSSGAFIVNETMANKLGGIDECIGKYIGFGTEKTQPIVGVVKNFHYESVKHTIGAMAIKLLPEAFSYMALKISPVNITETITYAEEIWKKIEPNRNFTYTFLDEKFAKQYENEDRMGKIVLIFAVLSALIACLGLFGLSSYAATQRTKEIGIRKVLGGTSTQITLLISKSFIKLTVIANLIALPLAYILLDKYWLPDFAVRINISILFLVGLGLISLLIALITVSFQAIKASIANPVESLRTE
ncbi:ABC transporter permease [Bacteroidota bacterium]